MRISDWSSDVCSSDLSRLMALATPLPAEHVAVPACAGRWLTEDVVALRDQPWADLSAMDGYAVRAAEWPGPWQVAAESAAGGPPPPLLEPGQARSEGHTSELPSLLRISYAVFCLKKKQTMTPHRT